MSAIPVKNCQKIHHFNQKSRSKQKSQSFINCEKVSIAKHYKNGFWRTKNQIDVFIKVFP